MYALAKTQTLQKFKTPKIRSIFEDSVLNNFDIMYRHFEDDRKLINNDRLIEISYEDLVGDPRSTVKNIYEFLKLDYSLVENSLDAYLDSHAEHALNKYVDGSRENRLVAQRWSAYASRYGYE
jgi:hypothetical protein